eukprot:12921482-Prorocentrum_lima.AAC.1
MVKLQAQAVGQPDQQFASKESRAKTDPKREGGQESGTEVVWTHYKLMEEPESHDLEMRQEAFMRDLTGQLENAIV